MQSLFVRNVCFHSYHTDGRSKTTWKCPANTEDRLHTLTRISFQLQVGRCSALGVTQISHLLFIFLLLCTSPQAQINARVVRKGSQTHINIYAQSIWPLNGADEGICLVYTVMHGETFFLALTDPVLSCPVLRTSGQQCNRRLGTRSTFSSSPYGQGHRLEINPRIHVFHRGEKLEQLGWKRKREILADRLNDLNPGTSSFQC